MQLDLVDCIAVTKRLNQVHKRCILVNTIFSEESSQELPEIKRIKDMKAKPPASRHTESRPTIGLYFLFPSFLLFLFFIFVFFYHYYFILLFFVKCGIVKYSSRPTLIRQMSTYLIYASSPCRLHCCRKTSQSSPETMYPCGYNLLRSLHEVHEIKRIKDMKAKAPATRHSQSRPTIVLYLLFPSFLLFYFLFFYLFFIIIILFYCFL